MFKSLLFVVVSILSLQARAQNNPGGEPAMPVSSLLSVTDDSAWHFVVGGGLVLNPTAYFSGGMIFDGTTTTSFNTVLEMKAGVSLALEGRYMPANSWGFMGGLDISSTLDGDKATVSGGISGSGSSDAKLQVSNLYGSAVYRWNTFYIPFGLNFGSVNFTPATSSTGSTSSESGVGAQLGLGFILNPNWAVEANSMSTKWSLKGTTATTTTDYGSGFISSIRLQMKYIF